MENQNKSFFGDGFFDWQFSGAQNKKLWDERQYNEEKYWGGFSKDAFDPETYKLPYWAIGNFRKYGAPVFAPSADTWDCGHFGGGVHNGSLLVRDGVFYYLYRGEFPIPESERAHPDIDYKGDIGIASSTDGIHYKRLAGPLFRGGQDDLFSFEDVNVVEYDGRYYMFLNRWDWANIGDPSVCGIFLAVSGDLLHWEKIGLCFPDAKRIHRNACVLQDPQNRAVKASGRFVMYINDGLIAYSDDLIHWESSEMDACFPGGEGCFALADYDAAHPDNIILFTGGPHTGHFYAIGEVLLSKTDPAKPLEWLPRPVLAADKQYPWEDGLSEQSPHVPVSYWRDTIFFTGMTLWQNQWRIMYGGSEYYTCLATAQAKHPLPVEQ